MTLARLDLHHFRRLRSARFLFHPKLNILIGANGCGKTSILEALYMLSTGHSFRTREISPLVTYGQEELVVFSETIEGTQISLKKSIAAATRVQIDQQPCLMTSELARRLPCQVFHHDIFQIIDAGPALRRELIDWGLFHVKHDYLDLWKDYRRVLKQKNALLRQKAPQKLCVPWDKMIVELSTQLDKHRTLYVSEWFDIFNRLMSELSAQTCALSYYKGWDKKNSGKSLAEYLTQQYEADLHRGYTGSGAHQADIFFHSQFPQAKLTLSRGQQKIILIALKLAQTQMLAKECIYLMDDIAAELDKEHLERLMNVLAKLSGQVFITTLEKTALPSLDELAFKVFHIENMVNG